MTEAERAAALADEIERDDPIVLHHGTDRQALIVASLRAYAKPASEMVCEKCGSVSRVGVCDCTKDGLEPRFVPRSTADADVWERVEAAVSTVSGALAVGGASIVTAAALSAIRPGDKLPGGVLVQAGSRVKHLKRGTTYRVLDTAKIQSTLPLVDGATVVVYRSESDGRLWARDYAEMHDGRFEVLAAEKGADAEPEQPTWADWWTTPHDRLDGKRPCDDPAGALELLAAIVHGLPA